MHSPYSSGLSILANSPSLPLVSFLIQCWIGFTFPGSLVPLNRKSPTKKEESYWICLFKKTGCFSFGTAIAPVAVLTFILDQLRIRSPELWVPSWRHSDLNPKTFSGEQIREFSNLCTRVYWVGLTWIWTWIGRVGTNANRSGCCGSDDWCTEDTGHWTVWFLLLSTSGKNFGRTAAEPAMSCQLIQLQGSTPISFAITLTLSFATIFSSNYSKFCHYLPPTVVLSAVQSLGWSGMWIHSFKPALKRKRS